MDHLKNLGLDETASTEDVKAAYKKLAKQYHPDLNKNGEERFKSIKASYEWLMIHHVPKKPKWGPNGYVPYYEILGRYQETVTFEIYNDGDELERGIVIYLMKNDKEYRVFIEKGSPLPRVITLTNVGTPITIRLRRYK